MSGKRDRLGLLLPIPALLAVEPGTARAEEADDATIDGLGAAAEVHDGPDIGPYLGVNTLSRRSPAPPPRSAHAGR